MKITQSQLREAAQILYPKEWKESPGAALVAALKYLHEASFNFETRPAIARTKNSNKDGEILTPPVEIADLQAHLKENEIHITAAARAIGINSVTLYSWFHGHSKPKPENLTKIRSFLAKSKT